MENKTITITFTECALNELREEDRALVEVAIAATGCSYTPYSHFNVGAAVRLEDGTIVRGCNQENGAYSVTVCAERSALFAAGATYPDVSPVAIAIAARSTEGLLFEPVTPCGVCRQAMVETEQRYGRRLRILLYGTRCVYVLDGVKTLLPLSFTL